jgi:hypothetical protein
MAWEIAGDRDSALDARPAYFLISSEDTVSWNMPWINAYDGIRRTSKALVERQPPWCTKPVYTCNSVRPDLEWATITKYVWSMMMSFGILCRLLDDSTSMRCKDLNIFFFRDALPVIFALASDRGSLA